MSYIGSQPVPQSTRTIQEFTVPSGGQTTFATAGYVPNFIQVTLNGVRLAATDYTATNGSDVVLTTAAVEGDVLCVDMQTELVDVGAGFASTSEVQGTHTTGSITSGTTSLTVASGSGISNGDYVVGEGITPGTTVSSGGGTTSITLSANAGATLSSDSVSFYNSTKALSPGLVAGGLCRAWVNFNGVSQTIRAAYNISSISYATGDYTVNFATAMPHANYAAVKSAAYQGANYSADYTGVVSQTTSAFRFYTGYTSNTSNTSVNSDVTYIEVAIFC